MRLSANISQNMSLQLTTSMALDEGLKDVHEIVRLHEKEPDSKGFINDIKSYLVRSNNKRYFKGNLAADDLLKNNTALLDRVIQYALKRHRGEYRDSGHLYLAHVLSTGFILARLGFPKQVILSGILHDSVEDSQEKNQVLNDLFALAPAVAWYVFSVSAPDIRDAVEKDMILYKKLDAMAATSGSFYPKAIKCADGIANLFDIEFLKPKDGRSGPERQKLFLENTQKKILPYAREIDHNMIIPVKSKNEIFSMEAYILDLMKEKQIQI